MNDWLQELARLRKAGEPAMLVTVAGVRGSAPREVGAKMIVTRSDVFGTIGGGALEYQCTRIAAERLQADMAGGCLRRFPLGSNCGQCCGGVVDILFEPLAELVCIDALHDCWSDREDAVLVTVLDTYGRPAKGLLDGQGNWHGAFEPATETLVGARELLVAKSAARRHDTPGRTGSFLLLEPIADAGFDVAVFGAGHVGSALVQLLAELDCNLRWIDSRRAIFPESLAARVQCLESSDPARDVAALPAGTCYFVMTHSHALDLDITAAILRRGDFQYCGLIGSLTKRKRFEARLRKLGIGARTLQRLTCPIGIRGISGKKPQEIAIAAAAEVLRRRERQLVAQQDAGNTVHSLNAQ